MTKYKNLEYLKKAIKEGRAYVCQFCGKIYIEKNTKPQCQHNFLILEDSKCQ